jgi:hypothetical protein
MGANGSSHWTVAAWRAGRTTGRVFWRLGRQLFHEAIGTLFGLFAIYGGVAWWKQSREPGGQWIAGMALGYAVLMAFFSVLSFRSARRVR